MLVAIKPISPLNAEWSYLNLSEKEGDSLEKAILALNLIRYTCKLSIHWYCRKLGSPERGIKGVQIDIEKPYHPLSPMYYSRRQHHRRHFLRQEYSGTSRCGHLHCAHDRMTTNSTSATYSTSLPVASINGQNPRPNLLRNWNLLDIS